VSHGVRIAPLEPPYESGIEELLAKWMPPGAGVAPLALFRTLAVHNDLAARMRPLGRASWAAALWIPCTARSSSPDLRTLRLRV
jgi:hypothetical protein